MKRLMWFSSLCAVTVIGTLGGQENASRNQQLTPEALGLPVGNARTSQPFVVRRYKADADNPDKAAKQQPPGFVKTIEDGYTLGVDETFRVHEGVDFSSRPGTGKAPAPVEFKAGVFGKVVKAGGGDWNTVTVQLADGSVVQYLHASKVIAAVGQMVTPDTPLGLTGKKGTTDIHLHVQARGADGKTIQPDQAFLTGRRRPATTIDWPDVKWVDFEIEAQSKKVPNVKAIDGKVRITYDDNAPKSTMAKTVWVSRSNSGRDVSEQLIVFGVNDVNGYDWSYAGSQMADRPWEKSERYGNVTKYAQKHFSGTWKAKSSSEIEVSIKISFIDGLKVSVWEVSNGKLDTGSEKIGIFTKKELQKLPDDLGQKVFK